VVAGLIRMQLQKFVTVKEKRLEDTSGNGNKSWPFPLCKEILELYKRIGCHEHI